MSPDPLPDDFAHAFAQARGRLNPLASSVSYFPSIGSTNDVAAALVSRGSCEGAVVLADAQTAGRGRRGRTWFSPAGAGLYASVVLLPGKATAAPERATALLTLMAGVALAEAVERTTGLPPAIKWPNDLIVGRRKLAGILAEGVASPSGGVQSVILGYGINVSAAAYPPELGDRVTSLESELGRPIDRAVLCVETLVSLATWYRDLIESRYDAILGGWRQRASGHRGARVSWETPAGPQTGITDDVDEMGALLVRVGDRVERLVAGEVRWN